MPRQKAKVAGSFVDLAPTPDLSGVVPTSQKGAANGVASLDGSTKIPAGQIPAITSAMITDGTIVIGDLAFDPATQVELDAEATARANAVTAEATARAAADTALQAASMGVVVHGSVANTARPAGFGAIHWIGSVAPTNSIDNDVWTDTSA